MGEVLCLMWMMRWILLITIMLPERPGTTFGVTLERCNAMAVGGNTTINLKGDDRNSDGDGNGDGDRQR